MPNDLHERSFGMAKSGGPGGRERGEGVGFGDLLPPSDNVSLKEKTVLVSSFKKKVPLRRHKTAYYQQVQLFVMSQKF